MGEKSPQDQINELQPRIMEQEIIRRNLDSLVSIARTLAAFEGQTKVDIQEKVRQKIMSHLDKLKEE